MLKQRLNMVKFVICFSLVLILLFGVFSLTITALDANEYDFANFTEADSMEFVYDSNITIPDGIQQLETLPAFTLDIILKSFNNPDVPFAFSYGETQKYAEEIRSAVKNHIDPSAVPAMATTTAYHLQDSKVKDINGNWTNSGGYYNLKWLEYNCYAYSINRVENPQYYESAPYIQYQPGDMSRAGNFMSCETIYDLAELVAQDLAVMGYANIATSYTIPTINSSQELICVRMDDEHFDYHFL